MSEITWVCPRDGERLTIDGTNKGPGVPACHRCQSAMVQAADNVDPFAIDPEPQHLVPGLAAALSRLDPELQQEPHTLDGSGEW